MRRVTTSAATLAIVAATALFAYTWYALGHMRDDYLVAFGGHYWAYLAMPLALASAGLGFLLRARPRAQLFFLIAYVLLTLFVAVDFVRLLASLVRGSHAF